MLALAVALAVAVVVAAAVAVAGRWPWRFVVAFWRRAFPAWLVALSLSKLVPVGFGATAAAVVVVVVASLTFCGGGPAGRKLRKLNRQLRKLNRKLRKLASEWSQHR